MTTSNKNNGVSGTSSFYTEKGNVITFDSATEGKCFYQESNFTGSDHVEILEPVGYELNLYMAMYLVTILNMEMFRYSFGRKRAQKRMKSSKIHLPCCLDGDTKKPDFNFMERYVKTLPYSKSLCISP